MLFFANAIGRLGKDPEMRFTPNGDAVTNVNIAIDASYKDDKGNKIERTLWMRGTAWRKLGEIINEYAHKGDLVSIVFELAFDPKTGGPRLWTAQDGTLKASYEITILSFHNLTSKKESQERASGTPANKDVVSAPEENSSDSAMDDVQIPF